MTPTANALRSRLDAQMTEADFQGQVIEFARLHGWLVAHFRPAQTAHGWRTPVAADGSGFPDLILVRDRLVIVELKSETGKLSAEQSRWMAALEAAQAEHYVWRPRDWPQVETVLSVQTAARPDLRSPLVE